MRRVELFEFIRRDANDGTSIRTLARRYKVHRRTVRQALASSVPPERRRPERRPPVLTPELRAFVDEILVADREAPRKQRHTARRIWQRLGEEKGVPISESTVRTYVGRRKRELGVGLRAFVPQDHPIGRQGEVDFYEAAVEFPWGGEDAQIVVVRSEFSAGELHRGYPNQTQSALFDGIARGLEFLGGTFPVMRFDNLSQAVARVLRGKRRVEQDRFVAFRSHYGFSSSFTSPGLEGAHEKGGVENEVGRFRRRWLTPVPRMDSWEAFNDYLRRCCERDLSRRRERHRHTVGEDVAAERAALSPLPTEPFEVAEVNHVGVDQKSRAAVRTNRYSVPVHLAGRRVWYRLTPLQVEFSYQGKVVARHPRLHLKYQEHLVLDHYLELLHERPGAFPGSLALRQERDRGTFTKDHDALWARLTERWGERDGTRQMIEVLLAYRRHPRTVMAEAIRAALRLGVSDHRAVSLLARHLSDAVPPSLGPLEVGELHRYDRPAPDTDGYDGLLEGMNP